MDFLVDPESRGNPLLDAVPRFLEIVGKMLGGEFRPSRYYSTKLVHTNRRRNYRTPSRYHRPDRRTNAQMAIRHHSDMLEDERQLRHIFKLRHRSRLYLRRIEEGDYLFADSVHRISKKTRGR